ncbi:alpha/beta-hydrolase [Ceratobasidium sp. AG-I]|nr:alpha/beta-hydrolase [Ceratobasidium sp. AG-I]
MALSNVNIPSFNQFSETLRAVFDRGFQSPLSVALATAIPLITLYSTLPALSSGVLSKSKKPYPSLETLVVADKSKLADLKKRAHEIYPSDIYGPGHSVDLPNGRVVYWLIGPEDGRRVTLIHGISMPSLVWKRIVSRLSKAGFRVLIYDLYGRGYSEAPDAQSTLYDADLYVTQLALLLQAVGWRRSRIVGLSMGGGIASAFASKFPWLVESNVAFIASVGVMDESIGGVVPYVFGSPTFQRFRHSRLGQALFTPAPPPDTLSTLSSAEKLSKNLQTIVALQGALLPGYTPAVATSLFVGPLRGLEKDFEKVGKLKSVKVLIIWGNKDEQVNYKYAAKIKGLIPHAELVTVDGAGHGVCVTHSETVADSLIKFLKL